MSFTRYRRYALTVFAPLVASALLSQVTWAQGSTGKIVGRVTDAAGQPIQAAQVSIDGTNRGNISDARGNYFINEVPAGLVRIVAQRIGFQTVVVADQRVLAGQTLTLDFKLEQAAVQVEALVIQGERNPLVPRDQVSSKAIVTGETIDQLPMDNANSIILLQPGVISTNDGRTIRGSRPGEEAVYVDGVLVRRYGSGNDLTRAEPLELPTNSLAQVDVTTGGFGARFGEAQSGVINYVTRTGGSRFQGTAALQTDRIAPIDWTNGLTRGELSIGGPIYKNLTYFLATVVEGRGRAAPSEGRLSYFPVGVDTTFRVAGTNGDSLEVVFPEFQELRRGEGSPFSQSDEWTGTAKLSYGLGSGNKLDLSYYKNRNSGLAGGSFNPQNATASVSYEDVITLGGYFILSQSADRQFALDLKASYQRDLDVAGNAKPDYFLSHRSPFLGFNLTSPDFLADWHDYPVDENLVDAYRSALIIPDSTQIYPGRTGLGGRQAYEGYNSTLRINPYGIRSGFGLFGYDNTGISYSKEARWVFNGAIDWQANRYNRIQIGGDYTFIDIRSFSAPLYSGSGTPSLRQPRRGALFLTDRLDLGDVVIDGGIRFDYFNARTDYSRVPGFVYNLPDSLKAGLFKLQSDPNGTIPWEDRVVPLEDCGGQATLKTRTRADGTVVCKSNWVAAEVKKAFSPRLAVSFPVTLNSTFRLSYGHNVQVPPITELFRSQNTDFQGGGANTNTEFGRDIKLPRTVQFEAGYRQLFGSNLVMDVVAYSKTVRNGLTYRILAYDNPKIPGQTIRINSLTNADYSLTRGLELTVDRRLSQTANIRLNYSYVDAKGTGSDPLTYIDLISRSNNNVALLNNGLVDPPEVMLPLDQSRTHNFASTVQLTLPRDYNPVFADVGVFATIRVASGLPYTRILNIGGGGTGPPSASGGTPAEPINASHLPWDRRIDLKIQKGLSLAGKRVRAFADMRNPFNIANTNSVFIETGSVVNDQRFQNFAATYLNDQFLDGTDRGINGKDLDISKSTENPINKYALMQAEKRFGNGDGIYTVEEQLNMVRQYYTMTATNARTLRTSGQSMRLGFEINF